MSRQRDRYIDNMGVYKDHISRKKMKKKHWLSVERQNIMTFYLKNYFKNVFMPFKYTCLK